MEVMNFLEFSESCVDILLHLFSLNFFVLNRQKLSLICVNIDIYSQYTGSIDSPATSLNTF